MNQSKKILRKEKQLAVQNIISKYEDYCLRHAYLTCKEDNCQIINEILFYFQNNPARKVKKNT